MLVKDLMHKQLYTVNNESSVQEAAKIMAELNIGLLIVGSQDNIQGVFSERDLMTKVVGLKRPVETIKINDVMTKNVLTIKDSERFDIALTLMEKKKIRHLPVVDENNICVGMLGVRDLMGAMLNKIEAENTIIVEYLLAVSRVASIILEIASQAGIQENEKIIINYEMSHEEFEDITDTSKEALDKVLNNLQNEGLIELSENKIVILNKEKLLSKVI